MTQHLDCCFDFCWLESPSPLRCMSLVFTPLCPLLRLLSLLSPSLILILSSVLRGRFYLRRSIHLAAFIHTSNKSLASSPRYDALLLLLPHFLILISRFTLQSCILLTYSCRTTHQTSLTLGSNAFLKSRGLNNIKSSSESDSRSESSTQSDSGRRDLHSWIQVA